MRTSNLVKVDILLNATVDALSLLIHVDNAYHIGKMCEKLKDYSRQQFDIPIQAAIGEGNFRETIKARKDVTAKCYGGDISVNVNY
jgi:GTP-binding protein LepA